jgi:tetratricopeptide (TPR) repeat protein
LARSLVCAVPKEKKMKRNLTLWLGLLAFAAVPMFAQTPAAPMGKIHGHVTDPTGVPEAAGNVSLSKDGGQSSKYTFQVVNGEYSGQASPGTYMVIFRQPDTPADKVVDSFENIKIVADQEIVQDFDMTRQEFVSKLPPELQKQIVELKKKNADASNVLKHLNADLAAVVQDFKEADGAHQLAVAALGASATKADIADRENEIRTAKYTDAENLMLKDTAAKSDESVLWAQLGQAQLGLKKYDEAEVTYKKVLSIESEDKHPVPMAQGAANAGLGEIYARTGKVSEANAAYDAAAKVNPKLAAFYFKNEAVIFSQVGNGEAQNAAADEAIKADPSQPVPYYLKGQALIQKATIDPAGKMILPPGCAEAYQKYLDLAPNGAYATDVKGILAEASQVHNTGFGNTKKKKSGN